MTILGIIAITVAALTLIYWFLIKMLQQEEPNAAEVHTIETVDRWQLKLFRTCRENCTGEPVFFVHGFIANPFNFLAPKNASMVDALAAKGYDCWVIDLRCNHRSKPPLGISRYRGTFADYYNKDIPAALDYIREQTGYEQVHWVGHSMGGMLLYAFAAVHGTDRIATGTTLASPPGFKKSRTLHFHLLPSLIAAFPFYAERVMHAVAPLSHLEFREHSAIPINAKNMRPGLKAYNMVELPPVGVIKQMNHWAHVRDWILEEDVDMDAFLPTMNFPLHLVAAATDRIAPPHTIEQLYLALPTRDKRLTVLSLAHGTSMNYNHIDIPFGLNANREVFDPVAEFLAKYVIEQAFNPEDEEASDAPKSKKSAPRPGSREAAQWDKALEDASHILDSLSDESMPSHKKKPASKKPGQKEKPTRRPEKK